MDYHVLISDPIYDAKDRYFAITDSERYFW